MFRITCLIVFVAALGGCLEVELPPAGSYSEVLLVTEEGSNDPSALELTPQLAVNLNYYVDEELQFKVSHIAAANLTEYPALKNIVICGVADELTSVGRLIVSLLGPAAVERVRAGTANIFKQDDLPGAGQVTIIVTAASEEALSRVVLERGHEVNVTLEASCRERLRSFMLKYKNESLSRHMEENYDFTVAIPGFYRLLSEDLEPPGVELLREGPARLLGVFWLDWREPPTLDDADALFAARSKYVWERYDGDEMDSTRVAFSRTRLGPYPAIKMEGYWDNTRSVAGGYYESYFVFEESEELLWVVDLLVYAPGMDKHPLFRELLALAETFRFL